MPSRPAIRAEDFLDAAVRVAAADGWESVSVRGVCRELDVDPALLYRHFRGLADLLAAALDRFLAPVVELAEDLSDGARAALDRTATALRELLLADPALTAALVAIPDAPPNSLRLTEALITALRALGLDGDDLVQRYQALENFVLGACLIDGQGGAAATAIRAGRYAQLGDPAFRTVAATPARVAVLSQEAFDHGVRLHLDAAERAGSVRRR